MTDTFLIMTDESVRKILADQKNMTRRVINPQPVFSGASGDSFEWHGGRRLRLAGYGAAYIHSNRTAVEDAMLKVSRFQPGQRVWVKEAWRLSTSDDCACYEPCGCKIGVPIYRATSGDDPDDDGWISSRHMPRRVSRLTLELTAVRVERLQDITEEDAIAEGVERDAMGGPVAWYEMVWKRIHGSRSWQRNPWVYVLSFKRV